jgi:hypothetical protein
MMLAAAQRFQESGVRILHLGGGLGGRNDSLMQFKLHFDPGGLRQCAIGKLVHDAATYRRLSGTDDVEGFFPRYRAPVGAAGGTGR